MKFNHFFAALSAVAIISGLSSCERPEDVKLPPELKIEETSVKVLSTEGQHKIPFTLTNPVEGSSVKAECSADWIEASVISSEIVLDFQANIAEERSADVKVSYPQVKDIVISVVQAAAGDNIVLSATTHDAGVDGGDFKVTVSSDRDWTMEGAVDWITASANSGKSGDKVKFTIKKNDSSESRSAKFVFNCASKSAELTINQEGGSIVASIKDKVLKKYLLELVDKDSDGNISAEEAKSLKSLEINFEDSKANKIESLDGLQSFTALESVILNGHGFVEADFSACPELKVVSVAQSKFLSIFNIAGCSKITNINVSSCAQLTDLDLTGCPELKEVNFFGTQVASVDLSKCAKLESLVAYSAKLESLDLTANVALKSVMASGNPLKTVTFPETTEVTELSIGSAYLASIDLKPCPKLISLDLSNSPIKSIDLTPCPELESLRVNFCSQLTSLDISKNYHLRQIDAFQARINKVKVFEGQWSYIKTFGIESTVNLETVPLDYPEDCAALISDAGLRNYIISTYDKNADGKISGEEAQTVTEIVYSAKGLKSFDNFVFFRNVVKLDLSHNLLTSVDLSPFSQTLTDLDLSYNQLTDLSVASAINIVNANLSNNKLESISGFSMDMEKLLTVDASHNQLKKFKCSFNSSVETVNLSYNNLVECDLEGCTALKHLNVSHNKLNEETYVLVRPYTWTAIETIDFSYNDFTKAESDANWTGKWNNLTEFSCEGCAKMASLDLSPNAKLMKLNVKECPLLSTVKINASANPVIEKGDNTTIEK